MVLAESPLLLLLLTLTGSNADIDCYSCGHRNECDLPFKVNSGIYTSDNVDPSTLPEVIVCPEACIKFDGYADNDKHRVIVRDCETSSMELEQANICLDDYEYLGAHGVMCTCNSASCNEATRTTATAMSTGLVALSAAARLLM